MHRDFIDEVDIRVVAGSGGNGAVSFRREKYVPKGGPDGGDGGRGGNVILVVNPSIKTLEHLRARKVYKAGRGEDGKGKNRHGKNGQDIIIELPPGTMVFDSDRNLLVDMKKSGQKVVIARGGKGGKGNTHFKSPTNQVPMQSTPGNVGEEKFLHLELKVIADVGLVGLPNAGKSTLLKAMTRANPRIASYEFTTLHPNLGVFNDGQSSFVIADIPGLIEGASHGKGLGIRFLKHIERTRLICYVISVESDIISTLNLLKGELEAFSKSLANRDFIIAINKIDLISDDKLKDIISNINKVTDYADKTVFISAATGKNILTLAKKILTRLF